MAQEEIIFKVGVDTGDSVQDVNKVGDAIENVGKDAKKTDGSFVNLRKELKQLTIQLQNLDPASKEFETVARRAGQIKEQMRGVADAINDADPEKFGGKFQRTAEGIAGAFSAVTGAQALFGQQSEEIEKQMLKVQGAIALTQGISAMKELKNDALDFATSIKTKLVGAFTSLTVAEMANAEATGTMTLLQKAYALAVGTSTGAMKVFRLALVSTGIGALVVLVGFLIEKIASFVSNTDEATLAQNRFNSSVEKYNKQQERTQTNMQKQIDFQLNFAKAVGASEDKIYEIEKSGLRKREKLRQQDLKDNQFRIDYLRWAKQQAIEDENEELVKSINEEITALKTKNNNLIDLKYQLQRDEIILTAQHNTDLKNEQNKKDEETLKKQEETYKKQLEEIHQANLKRIELENQRIAEQESLENEYYDSFKTQQQLEEQAVRDKYFTIIQTTKDNETLLLAQQKELDAIANKYKEEADKVESERLNNIGQQYEDFVTQYTEAVNTASENEKLAVNDKYNYLIEKAKEYGFSTVELEKKRAAELKEIDSELLQAKEKFVGEVSNMLGALAGAAQQGSVVQKAFAVAQVTVDTAKAISSTIAGATAAAAAGGPAAPFLIGGYIASGIATVTKAFSSVNNILKKPMPNVQPPSGNRPNENTQTSQQGTTQNIQAQSTYKVVVLDSDITKMQDKTKKVNAISTI